jgi:hypothetical protein
MTATKIPELGTALPELERAVRLLFRAKHELRKAALPLPGSTSSTYVLIALIDSYFSTLQSVEVPK